MTTALALSSALSEVVRDLLSSRGITRREAATKAGIPLTTLQRKLAGASPFNAVELAALANVAGVTLTDLALKAERHAGLGAA